MMDEWDDESAGPVVPGRWVPDGEVSDLALSRDDRGGRNKSRRTSSSSDSDEDDEDVGERDGTHIYEDGLTTLNNNSSSNKNNNETSNTYAEIPLSPSPSPTPSLSDSWASAAESNDMPSSSTFTSNQQQQQQQQHPDLPERVASLTRAINANMTSCLAISGRMLALARENGHLAQRAGSSLDAYVVRPALRGLAAYCGPEGMQTLRGCETRVRRAAGLGPGPGIGESASGRGGRDGRGEEVTRLKDRLVEQDAVLRDSSLHIRKLMAERDELRRELKGREQDGGFTKTSRTKKTTARTQAFDSKSHRRSRRAIPNANANPNAYPSPYFSPVPTPTPTPNRGSNRSTNPHGADDFADDDEGRDRERQLTEQLEELRVLVDQMALHEVPNRDRRRKKLSAADGSPSSSSPPAGGADSDEDAEWTLL